MGRGVSSCINYTEEESLVGIVPLTYCLLLDLDSFSFFFSSSKSSGQVFVE